MMRKKLDWDNKNVIKSAKHLLVGGVNSPVRSFKQIGVNPIPIKKGFGSKIYDYDGKNYIDYVLSYGAMILGHAHQYVVDKVSKSIRDGFAFGATGASEVELANLIHKAIPYIEKIRFVNSGTEAVMGAIRLTRGYTGRDKILKFTNAYHGHADYLLARSGSGMATLNIPTSKGVPKDFLKHTLIINCGDYNSLDAVFKRYGSDIAAVIIEPVGGNHGVVLPDIEFLGKLRSITQKYGSLLIFDEIITGFRFCYGSVASILGVQPDIICLGKIIGGGLPIGAFGGLKDVMNQLAPEGNVYQASTFAGNPIVMTSGAATLEVLYSLRQRYGQLSDMVGNICKVVKDEAKHKKISVKGTAFKAMFGIKFSNSDQFKGFYKKMLSAGIYFAPSEYEANFISFAHTEKDIEKTEHALRQALNN